MTLSRRAAVGAVVRLAVATAAFPRAALGGRARRARRVPVPPEPRPGITAERVLAAEKVPKKYADAYDAARELPEVLDGLYCHCDCAERDGLRSLLECYYGTMPQSCRVCLNEARMARRLHDQGRTLDEIRRAVDDEYRD